jgi:lysine 6-dehydrogenase
MAMGAVDDLINLESTSEIHVADWNENAMKQMKLQFDDPRLFLHKADANKKEIMIPLMSAVDGILSAASYEYNLSLSAWALESGCHLVDLGGNYLVVEKQFKLDKQAKKAGVGIIPDCGLAPGMVSVVAAHGINRIEKAENVSIRVGGLPVEPKTPLKYMLIFSVKGLTNEYIEDAIILENAKIKKVKSMSEIESIKFPEPFGNLEAFYTSGGTSTLPNTFEGQIKNLNYKTIRYPGHGQLFKEMIELGFTNEKLISLRNLSLPKREVFERLLEDSLSLEGDDVTLIRVTVEGQNKGENISYEYQAIEYGDKQKNLTAMMRTTAYPAIIALEMLVQGKIKDRGVLRQEVSIPPDLFLNELAKRNIKFDVTLTRNNKPHDI